MVRNPRLMRLVDDSSGATAAEYALIVNAIAGIIAAVVYVVGAKTNNLYSRASYSLRDVGPLELGYRFVGGKPTRGLLLPPSIKEEYS